MLNMVKEDHQTVKSELKLLSYVQEWFEEFCHKNLPEYGWTDHQIYGLNLALAEGFTNAVRHAHYALPSDTNIDIQVSLWQDRVEVRIWDYGQPFDPNMIDEPEPGTLQVGGYGWFLLRRLADKVVYQRDSNNRNCLLIVKYCAENRPSK